MKIRRRKFCYLIVFLFSLSLLADSCTKSNTDTSSLYTPTAADVTAKASLVDLQQGRSLYINNCGRCHGLYSPDSYTSTQWTGIIKNMAGNTALSASEILLVSKYVTKGK
jgi:mono/diheme cytochrome c family protein